MHKLICVGGPLAGEVYEVSRPGPVMLPAPQTDYLGEIESVVYTVDSVSFCGRVFPVLLYPPLRAQHDAAQQDAIMRAMLNPEAYTVWEAGRTVDRSRPW